MTLDPSLIFSMFSQMEYYFGNFRRAVEEIILPSLIKLILTGYKFKILLNYIKLYFIHENNVIKSHKECIFCLYLYL